MDDLTRTTNTSMEAAEWCGKKHTDLLRDIRRYTAQLAESKIALGDFFQESSYQDANNQTRPCFLVTKKGCEFIAHKMTGQKGTEFTARYINRFHEMENNTINYHIDAATLKGIASTGNLIRSTMRDQGAKPYKVAVVLDSLFKQSGLSLPSDFIVIPEYEQAELSDFLK